MFRKISFLPNNSYIVENIHCPQINVLMQWCYMGNPPGEISLSSSEQLCLPEFGSHGIGPVSIIRWSEVKAHKVPSLSGDTYVVSLQLRGKINYVGPYNVSILL